VIIRSDARFGPQSQDRRQEARSPGRAGAVAAVESFYYAFNTGSLEVLEAVWRDDPLVQLNNPLGGIVRGAEDIRSLYARIFTGAARAWVELHDVVEFEAGETVVFAGRERGEFIHGDTVIPLSIRTSRVFMHDAAQGWRQVHHHGSIDDPEALRAYQRAVASP
jgi:ketosteroid isomerase-like protein